MDKHLHWPGHVDSMDDSRQPRIMLWGGHQPRPANRPRRGFVSNDVKLLRFRAVGIRD